MGQEQEVNSQEMPVPEGFLKQGTWQEDQGRNFKSQQGHREISC